MSGFKMLGSSWDRNFRNELNRMLMELYGGVEYSILEQHLSKNDWLDAVGEATLYVGESLGTASDAKRLNVNSSKLKNKTISLSNTFKNKVQYTIWYHSQPYSATASQRIKHVNGTWNDLNPNEYVILTPEDTPSLSEFYPYMFVQFRYMDGSDYTELENETGFISVNIYGESQTKIDKGSNGKNEVGSSGLFYDVTDFGADDKGGNNASIGINKAIIKANSRGGGTVYIPQGTYNLEKTSGATCLDVLSNVKIIGDGVGATTLKVNKDIPVWLTHPVSIKEGVKNVYLSNFTLDGGLLERYEEGVTYAEKFQNGEEGISSDGHNVIVENVEFKNIISEGFDCDDGGDTILNNVTFENIGGNAIHFSDLAEDSPANIIVSNFRINNAGHIRGEYDQYNNAGAITLRPKNLVISNGVVTNVHRGLNIKNVATPLLVNNVIIKGCERELIRVMECNNNIESRIGISGCHFERVDSYADEEYEDVSIKDAYVSISNNAFIGIKPTTIKNEGNSTINSNGNDGIDE